MFGRIKSLFASSETVSEVETVPTLISPEVPFTAVGDIHGCTKELNDFFKRSNFSTQTTTVFVGDFVDRGPDSAGVLKTLYDLQTDSPDTVICLMGNHEKMMLDFIDDPAGRGARWLKFGGADTLRSFGLKPLGKSASLEAMMDVADALEDAMPDGMLRWVRDLPTIWSSGNVHCVHAAMDPDVPVDKQNVRTLLWGHPEFFEVSRQDGHTVIHGHTIVRAPKMMNGRISIDTGAYKTGRLTGVSVDQSGAMFI